MAKTWREKFENGRVPVVEVLDKTAMGWPAGTRMLISTPAEIDAEIRGIGRGKTRQLAEIRNDLAMRHGADFTCPLTTGIFARIAAEVAWDDLDAGGHLDSVTPFWRVVEPKSPLAKKLRCGPDWVAARRAEEARSK